MKKKLMTLLLSFSLILSAVSPGITASAESVGDLACTCEYCDENGKQICPQCGGTHKACNACGNMGVCPICNGEDSSCETCSGSGECMTCDGDPHENGPDACTYCEEGKVDCTYCEKTKGFTADAGGYTLVLYGGEVYVSYDDGKSKMGKVTDQTSVTGLTYDSTDSKWVMQGFELTANCGVALYVYGATEIEIAGSNSITANGASEGEKAIGIYAHDDLTLSGTGSLNVTAAGGDERKTSHAFFACGSLENEATLTLEAGEALAATSVEEGSYGLYVKGSLTNGGKIVSTSDDSKWYTCAVSIGNNETECALLNNEGGEIEATTLAAEHAGMAIAMVSYGDLTNKGTITATAGAAGTAEKPANGTYGIITFEASDILNDEGAEMTATAADCSTTSSVCGIYSTGSLTNKGTMSGTGGEGAGMSYGVASDSFLNNTADAELTGIAKDAAASSCGVMAGQDESENSLSNYGKITGTSGTVGAGLGCVTEGVGCYTAVNEGTITGTAGNGYTSYGFSSFGKVTNSGTMTATAGSGTNVYGIFISHGTGDDAISNGSTGKITAKAGSGTGMSFGIYSLVPCTIENNGKIKAAAGDSAAVTVGIAGGEVTLGANSSTTAKTGELTGADGYDYGIYSQEVEKGVTSPNTISAGDGAKLLVCGGMAALYGNLTVYEDAPVLASLNKNGSDASDTGVSVSTDGNYAVTFGGATYAANQPRYVNIAMEGPSAEVADVTVSGTVGTAITDTDVVVTVEDDTFAATLSGNWITNLPAGLTQSVARTDDTTATVTVSGTPTAKSSAKLSITIPAAQLETYEDAVTADTNNNAKYAITKPSAAVADVTIRGRVGTAITDTDVVVTLTDDTFAASLSGNWITNLPAGLNQSVARTTATTATITVSGTPTATGSAALSITIPASQLTVSASNMTVDENTNAKYSVVDPSATVGNVTVSGTVGAAITNTDVVVTLTGDTFAASLTGNWITNLPAGLTQSVARTGDTTATITVSGTPTAASSAALSITIPTSQLAVCVSDVTVTANANAKYDVIAPTAAVADVTVSGAVGTAITGTDVVVTLTDDTFAATLTGNWITNLPAGLTQSVARTNDTTATITVSGTPTAKSSAKLSITIPASQLVKCVSNVTVTANDNAKYAIVKPSAAVGNVTVRGTVGTAITDTDVVVTLTSCTFETTLSGEWITNLPAGLTQSVARTGDTTATITVSGTPTARSSAKLSITIPASQLASLDSAVTVDTNNNAKYAIVSESSDDVFGGFFAGNARFKIIVLDSVHGVVTADAKTAVFGKTITLTVEPDKGYTLETLTVLDKNKKECELTAEKIGEAYTFKMPASDVTVESTFMEDNTMLNYFVDVSPDDYWYDPILWAAENDIANGVDGLRFAPFDITTRAQMVTFLWRAAGSPEPTATACGFTDIKASEYYYKAVLWGVENGFVKGVSETEFAPDVTVTRGQCVTFLARMNGVKDEDSGYTHSFTDVNAAYYYNNAIAWASANGITTGATATTFAPDNDCLRGEIVTFIYRCFVK